MVEIEDYSSEDLRVAQRLIRDIGTNRTDIPGGLVGDLVGKIEGVLNKRRELATPIGYTPEEIERASKITESLLSGVDSNEAFLDGDKLMRVLTPKNGQEIIQRPKGLPELSISRLKTIVLAELGQISGQEDVPFDSSLEPEERAVINTNIINSWVDNTHLAEYLQRKEIVFRLLEAKTKDRLFEAAGVGSVLGVLGGIGGAFLGITATILTGIPALFVIPTIGGGLGIGLLVGRDAYKSKTPRLIISRYGITQSYRQVLDSVQISELQDKGDKEGILEFLSQINRAEVAQKLDQFIQKN